MKKKLLIMLAIMLLPIVNAQWIQPLDCEKLFANNEFVPQDEFGAVAKVCFYGSGYNDGSVAVHLDSVTNESNSLVLEGVQVSHGVLSSETYSNYFSGVKAGEYTLTVMSGEDSVQYSNPIYVYDESQIPEFSTLSLVLALGLAGLFIIIKRG